MKKVLIIDDEEPIRENIQEYLENLDFDVVSAPNGATGIQLAISELPDIIICDIGMPDINGYKVFQTLQEIESTMTIPFVFLTAKTQAEDITLGLELGVDDYITKPFRFKNLLTRIHKRLEKRDQIVSNTEKNFLTLTETPLLGIVILMNGLIKFANSKFESLVSQGFSKLLDASFSHFLHPGDQMLFEGKTELLAGNPNSKAEMQITLVGANGNEVRTIIYARSIKTEGHDAILLTIREQQADQRQAIGQFGFVEENKTEQLLQQLINDGKQDLAENLVNLIRQAAANTHNQNSNALDINLSKRELEVLGDICHGFTTTEIGERLFISPRTVDGHRNNLLAKTGAKNTATLVAFAIKHQLVNI